MTDHVHVTFRSAPTSFVGRERETAALASLVRDHRFVTVTGPGGAGKTRLALALAPSFFADVGSVDAAHLTDALAAALGEDAGQASPADLAALVGDRSGVLVVDGFEHLLDSATELAAFARACPEVRLLVTSRAPLRVVGEVVYEVPPLSEPDATRLFVERSRESGAAPLDDVDAVAEICRRLEGLPLAVELAAARTRLLRPAELLDRLADPLATLVGGARDAPARHRTLRATIEWSHGLLDREAQATLARLAVFEGAFTLEAAEAIAGALGTLETLLDHHLMMPAAGSGGVARHALHPAVREFARERLDPGTRDRHAGYFLGVAERPPGDLDQAGWLDAVDAEYPDLRAALAWWIERGEAGPAVRMVTALKWFWFMRGHLHEGRALAGAALALDEHPGALDTAAWLAQAAGDAGEAESLARHAVALYRAGDDEIGLAWALNTLGFTLVRGGADQSPEVVALFEEALALFRAHDDVYGANFPLSMLAFPALRLEPERARALLDESLATSRRLGDAQSAARALLLLAWVDIDREDTVLAAQRIGEALSLSAGLRHPYLIGYAVEATAELADVRGDRVTAVRLAAGAAALRERTQTVAAPALRARLARRLPQITAAELPLDALIAAAQAVTGTPDGTAPRDATLTPREVDVLRLVADGLTDAEIGARLYISVRTVNAHLRSIYTKLGVPSRAAATRAAIQRGVLSA
jgi:non-specific serine/threonine protein kinase